MIDTPRPRLERFNHHRQAMLREWSDNVLSGAISHALAVQEIRATSTAMAALMALHEEELLSER